MKIINFNGKLIDLSIPKVMGILNVTPDSFYDGNQFMQVEKAIQQVNKMVVEGMDILDIGGASSRPGAAKVDQDQEWERIEPILSEVITQFPELPISIDTFWSEVGLKALNLGVSMINDISGFDEDPKLLNVLADSKMAYVLMHMKGNPQNMQLDPNYKNVIADLLKYFISKISILEAKGITDIIIDPGFGFGKSIEHNYEILKHLNVFKILEKPIMVGISRKSMIYKYLEIDPIDSLPASSALHLQALLNGADIIRTHDIKEANQMIKLLLILKEQTL